MFVPFTKMHGAGNDFAVFDERTIRLGFTSEQVRALADRRLGIGCDQFITLEPPPPGSAADLFMRIRNPDGSEAGACGNATRCVALLLEEETGRKRHVIRTIAGDLPAAARADGLIEIDMGAPRLDWRDIPLASPADTLSLDLPGHPAALSMGNPHATLFVQDLATTDVARDGAALETNPAFPDRANIGFAEILSPTRIRLRVWERGAGLTLACGSGACAALVNAVRRGLAERRARLELDGGTLVIEWREDGHVLMTGPAAIAYRGTVEIPEPLAARAVA